jgi:hypothetical protein
MYKGAVSILQCIYFMAAPVMRERKALGVGFENSASLPDIMVGEGG